MRFITDHKVNPANDKIEIAVLDEPGSGGACHEYRASLPDGSATDIKFQNGPINEAGVNGLTHEALIAIVVDRMRDFQRGPYSCRENSIALTKLEEAQHWLLARTKGRMVRGVEGTHTV